jgi:hypothetical protein
MRTQEERITFHLPVPAAPTFIASPPRPTPARGTMSWVRPSYSPFRTLITDFPQLHLAHIDEFHNIQVGPLGALILLVWLLPRPNEPPAATFRSLLCLVLGFLLLFCVGFKMLCLLLVLFVVFFIPIPTSLSEWLGGEAGE